MHAVNNKNTNENQPSHL